MNEYGTFSTQAPTVSPGTGDFAVVIADKDLLKELPPEKETTYE